MKNKYRTIYCGKINNEQIDTEIKLSGWIENIRDHGGVIFVDLRDETGVVQLVSNDDTMFEQLTKESTITVEGTVRKRSEEDYNNKIATGELEVLVTSLTIITKANNILPFEVITSHEVSEDIRLKYRYLDLRNKKVHDNILLRSRVIQFLRNKMNDLGFPEIQTPILTVSSPEGARDFIVPSRKFQGKFYALPQAPQIFKQLLMTSGFDKYFQVAPCFRDEDARKDRTAGEFYQLDMEMCFVEEEEIYAIAEDIFTSVIKEFTDKKINSEFKRIPYLESMDKYGTDKPDLRNPLIITDISSIFENTEFKPFQRATIKAIKVDDIASNSNSWFNDIVDFASSIGMPGIGYVSVMEDMSFKGPIDKFLSEEDKNSLIEQADLKSGSVIFFIASRDKKEATKNAGQIRTYLGEKLELLNKDVFEFCIVNDFPMFEYDEEAGKYEFTHNPFSMPQGGMDSLTNKKPEEILAHQYDVVCNGVELVSGAIRNHDLEIMKNAFAIVGYDEEVLKTRFKSLYTAFQYGVPVHGGMAIGIDRLLMLMLDTESIRDTIAYPLASSGVDMMMGCPSEVSEQQLREVHIKIR